VEVVDLGRVTRVLVASQDRSGWKTTGGWSEVHAPILPISPNEVGKQGENRDVISRRA